MHLELVYDVASTSEAPRAALMLGLAVSLAVAAWFCYLKMRGLALHAGIKFLGFMAVLLLVLSAGLEYERRYIAGRTDFHTIEGPVAGHWNKRVRRAGKNAGYWEWEGFYIQGVSFAYVRNSEENYFHNAGTRSLELSDGMHLRLRYIEERTDGEVRNHILRVERGTGQAGS